MKVNLGAKIGGINVEYYSQLSEADFLAKFKNMYPEGLLIQAYQDMTKNKKKKKRARSVQNSK